MVLLVFGIFGIAGATPVVSPVKAAGDFELQIFDSGDYMEALLDTRKGFPNYPSTFYSGGIVDEFMADLLIQNWKKESASESARESAVMFLLGLSMIFLARFVQKKNTIKGEHQCRLL